MEEKFDFLPAPEKQDMNMDLKYLMFKLNDALEDFNGRIINGVYSDKELHERLDIVLRFRRQVKMMEDAIIVARLIDKADETD